MAICVLTIIVLHIINLGLNSTYSPKLVNAVRICLHNAICQKQEKLSVNSLWMQKVTKISPHRLNTRMRDRGGGGRDQWSRGLVS